MTTASDSITALYPVGKPRVYRGRQLAEIAFPLGGIGTGTVSLGGRESFAIGRYLTTRIKVARCSLPFSRYAHSARAMRRS